MRIAVIGAGGVGGYFGGRLAQAGEEVIFIARGEKLAALRSHGLRVDSVKGDFHLDPVQATDDASSIGRVDVVLVAVKTWQVTAAAYAIKPIVDRNTLVIPLENGLDAPRELAAVLGNEPVAGGLCAIVSFLAAPGHVRHTAAAPTIAFGELDNRRTGRTERLRAAFERAGVTVDIPDDIQRAMWTKFLFIAPLSGVGAVARVAVGIWRSVPETRALAEAGVREIETLAAARGVSLSPTAFQATMARYDALAPDATASLQRDVIDGKPSELDAQLGAVVRMGRESGVPTPVHEFLYASLLPQEKRARGERA